MAVILARLSDDSDRLVDTSGNPAIIRAMQPYERHVFVCVNERAPDNPKGCCSAKFADKVRDRLKKLTFDAGLRGRVRINTVRGSARP